MSATTSTFGRADAGSDLAAPDSTGRERGSAATRSDLGAAFGAATSPSLNIGAGCGPLWNINPFTRIAVAAHAITPNATASLWLQPRACSTNQRGLSSAAAFLRLALRTDLHPVVGALPDCGCCGARAGTPDRRKRGRPGCTFAVDRQTDGNAGAQPDTAVDVEVAAVQREQALDDREA